MKRSIFAFILGILAPVMIFVTGDASARELALSPSLCIGGADSAAEAMALEHSMLDCSNVRFAEPSPYVRSHTHIDPEMASQDGPLLWQSDPSYFDAATLRFTFADGETRTISVTPQTAVDNWFARTRFSVPVPQHTAPLTFIDLVVEYPRTHGMTKSARLITQEQAEQEHFLRSLFYALLCGLLLAPIFYDILFLPLLRSRFILWHGLMTVGHLGFVLSISGFVFILFPDISLYVRFHLNMLTLAVATFFASLLVVDLLEKGMVPKRVSRTLIGFSALLLVMKGMTILDLGALRLVGHQLFLLAFVPVSLTLALIVAQAVAKGSRAATYLVVATSGVLVCGVCQMLMSLGVLSPYFPIDDFMFAALILLVLGTSVAVADRVLMLRGERDHARASAVALERMAHRDALTGLANRRSYNQVRTVREGQALILADIDHFKAINDREGHQVGDAVLRHMASIMRETLANTRGARAYRIGGEEFAIIFDCADEDGLAEMGERLRSQIERRLGENAVGIPRATISLGATLGMGRSLDNVYAEADRALYAAKQAGRNRVAIDNGFGDPAVLRSEKRAITA